MVACEAWSAGRPIVVTAESPVVSSLCRRANGGASYADSYEFGAHLRHLAGDPEWANACGRSGQAFVQQHYRWDVVLAQLRALLEQTMPEGPRSHFAARVPPDVEPFERTQRGAARGRQKRPASSPHRPNGQSPDGVRRDRARRRPT